MEWIIVALISNIAIMSGLIIASRHWTKRTQYIISVVLLVLGVLLIGLTGRQ